MVPRSCHTVRRDVRDYAALRSISGRTRVSRQLRQAVISNPPLLRALGPGTQIR